MHDRLSREKRSWVMSRIRSRDTKPELVVRSLLHRCGFRYSLRRTDLPGKPDIVLRKYRGAVFVHGCFWHRHPGCPQATMPKSRTEFWRDKIARNQARDRLHQEQLRTRGWRVFVLWECEIMRDPKSAVADLIRMLAPERQPDPADYPALPERREILQAAEQKLQYNLRQSQQ